MNLGDHVSLEEIEKEHIRLVLESTKTLEEASTVLKLDMSTIYRKRRDWGFPARERKFAKNQLCPVPQ